MDGSSVGRALISLHIAISSTTYRYDAAFHPTLTGTNVIVSLPKMSITFTATVYRPAWV